MKIIDGKKYLTIAEASKKLGVSSNTLRIWDKEGKFKPDLITSKGYRLYLIDTVNNAVPNTINTNVYTIGYCLSSLDIKYNIDAQENLIQEYFNNHNINGIVLKDTSTSSLNELGNLKVLLHMITESNMLSSMVIVSRYIFTSKLWVTVEMICNMYNVDIIELKKE